MNYPVDYSIEYSHIYTDERFSWPQFVGTERVARIASDLDEQGASYSLSVLIDDYNPKEHLLDVHGFQTDLAQLDTPADFLALESRLVQYKDDLLGAITKPRLVNEYRRYIDSKGKVPCSFLVAVWYLARLGVYPLGEGADYSSVSGRPVALVGKRLINILPRRYSDVEESALEILRESQYAPFADKISWIMHESSTVETYAALA